MAINFLIESWTYLAIDVVVVFGRFFARWKSYGLKQMAIDDFLMIIALVNTTTLCLVSGRFSILTIVTAPLCSGNSYSALGGSVLVWTCKQRVRVHTCSRP
jgi:hypothetical protein